MADAVAEGHDYLVRSGSTDTFGRVVLSARDQHLVVDGPIQNGCPGEAITPAELLLGGVASCAVELIQVIARESEIPLAGVEAWMSGKIDRAHEVRSDVTVFSSATLRLALHGVGDEDAARLVAGFKGRCPLYGTVAVATPDFTLSYTVD
jgi:uncharacterized OsmC-like protein